MENPQDHFLQAVESDTRSWYNLHSLYFLHFILIIVV